MEDFLESEHMVMGGLGEFCGGCEGSEGVAL